MPFAMIKSLAYCLKSERMLGSNVALFSISIVPTVISILFVTAQIMSSALLILVTTVACWPRVSTNSFKSSSVLIGWFSFNITEWDL